MACEFTSVTPAAARAPARAACAIASSYCCRRSDAPSRLPRENEVFADASAMVSAEYRFCAACDSGSDAEDTTASCCWRVLVVSAIDRPAARMATMSTTAANVSRPGEVSRKEIVRLGYSSAGPRRSPKARDSGVPEPPSSRSSTRSSASRWSMGGAGAMLIEPSPHPRSLFGEPAVASRVAPSSDGASEERRDANRVRRGRRRISAESATPLHLPRRSKSTSVSVPRDPSPPVV